MFMLSEENMLRVKIVFLFFLISSVLFAQESYFNIPARDASAKGGSVFMNEIKTLPFAERENRILKELSSGNIPAFLRNETEIIFSANDATGKLHNIILYVLPDYLSVGSNDDFCRLPMGPIAAQKLADKFGAIMPTRKIVDLLYRKAKVKISPIPYAPVGNQNELVEQFIRHNNDIEAKRIANGGKLGELIGGIKKDVVISNKIIDPSRPNHVVIYGWHKLDGNAIQPLSNIHGDYYVDYSHGIRLISNKIIFDESETTLTEILKDPVLYKTLSDETGPMSQPTYIKNPDIPEKPQSFGLLRTNEGKGKLIISHSDKVEEYVVALSEDGKNFTKELSITTDEYIFEEAETTNPMYLKIKAKNNAGVSDYSEVLGASFNGNITKEICVINGFDRASAGNSYDFVIAHGNGIINSGINFSSATNEAMAEGLVDISSFEAIDYILGEESTVDETFSATEQNIITEFLKEGGALFVSGSEIAWDLDYKGTSSDKAFFHNYLKAKYSADAPGNVSGKYYSAEGIAGKCLESFSRIDFENGNNSAMNIKFADAILPVNGSSAILQYQNVSTHSIAGISYAGMFPEGTNAGKVICLGFPFEAVYPAIIRDSLMKEISSFLFDEASAIKNNQGIPSDYVLNQNYPNPFNPSTTISYYLPEIADVKIEIFNLLGERVKLWELQSQNQGAHSVKWNGKDSFGNTLPSATYICRMTSNEFSIANKMLLIK